MTSGPAAGLPPPTAVPWIRGRLSGDEPAGWSRYDTPGSTVYISDNDEIAFAEVLSGYTLKLGTKHPMQKEPTSWG